MGKSYIIPVVTVDGPSGSGKGTISQLLAKKLGYHYLDSGALYRLLGLAAERHGLDMGNVEDLASLAAHMDVAFLTSDDGMSVKVMLEGEDVSSAIRGEDAGRAASRVAVIPEVREALLSRQRAFASEPGLVADGRDMGTVVFPEARHKIFLTASPEVRAKRRFDQLNQGPEGVTLAALVEQVRERDERDTHREVSPLVPAADAVVIDSSAMTIDEVLERAMEIVNK
ncbi:MAG: (d)CMP kinase [bacterium]